MKIYLDNAATTPLDPEVIEAMSEVMKEQFGNPSSIHSLGREAKSLVELARKSIAGLLNCAPSEVFFTSSGTEADNLAIRGSVEDMGVNHIITSRIEHHAVTHTVRMLEQRGDIKVSYVNLMENGHVDLDHLKQLLQSGDKTLVTLMHANNEIGNLLPIKEVGELCDEHGALFHSDTVQTVGHYKIDLQEIKVHFITASAHKIHGPKGMGFLYINGDVSIQPLILGGSQEQNMRGGTENIYGIAGLATALEITHRNMEQEQKQIKNIKRYMMDRLKENIPEVEFNGDAAGESLYTVLNVRFPHTDKAEMLLYNLDIEGIAASGGSACASGSTQVSHVLEGIGADTTRPSIRFSFSKYTTREEIDFCLQKLNELFLVKV